MKTYRDANEMLMAEGPDGVRAFLDRQWFADREAEKLAEAEAAARAAADAELGAEPEADDPPHTDDPPDDAGDFDLSHDALANDLGRRGWDRDAKFVATWGKWLFWDGQRWRVDDRLHHWTLAREYLSQRAAEVANWAERKGNGLEPDQHDKIKRWAAREGRQLRAKASVAAIVELARSNPASVATPTDFDADVMLLGTPGGVVDLKTGKLRPAARQDMITKQTAVAPAMPGARPERWERFLGETFGGDREVIAFMQRAAGYALTGKTTEHKLLFLHGQGRNGKGVFLNTLAYIWADYARAAPAATFLSSQTERHPTDIAGLQGARLVIGSELPAGKTWDEAIIKSLTGGDTMTARYMRGDFFDFQPQLTLMIAGNSQPSFRGVDEAIRSRVVLVPFANIVPPEKRDLDLGEKLKAEAPAILRWAIDGALDWQRQGLAVPASVAAASSAYFEAEDTIGQFLADETTPVHGAFVAANDLHERFTQWCGRQGLHPWAQLTLIKEVRGRGFADSKSNGRRGLKGLRLQ